MRASGFWNWFKKDHLKYLFLEDMEEEQRDPLMVAMRERLHRFCKHLSFDIHPTADLHQQLVITANGNFDYFDKVNELIDSAPDIKDWQFIAFRQPTGFDHSFTYKDIFYSPADLYFLPMESEEDPAAVGILLYHPGYEEDRDDDFLTGAQLFLQHILGEFHYAQEIDYLEVCAYPPEDDPFYEDVLPFDVVPEFIQWKKKAVALN